MGRFRYIFIACVLVVCILAFNLRYFPFNGTTLLGTHYYGDNGLLVVNPDGPRLIFELIGHAEEAWVRKLDRACEITPTFRSTEMGVQDVSSGSLRRIYLYLKQ
jgi:hypothetical protein